MKVVRAYVPFLNKLVDISYFNSAEDLKSGSGFLINYKEEKLEEVLDAIFISIIEPGSIKVEIEKNINFFSKLNKSQEEKIVENDRKAKEFLKIFTEEYKKFGLSLIPIDSMLSFTEKTILFNYTSKERVDFRDLIKSLALKIKKKIQLRHIGPRDRSSLIGGYGICGRELCCRKFLRDIPSVKAESLREQDYFYKNTENLSGACGKLKCCLNYEVYQYKEMKKGMPDFGKSITVDGNKGTVIGLDIFNQKVKIKFEDKTVIYNLDQLPNHK